MTCQWCGEPLEDYERHPLFDKEPMHYVCFFRSVAGSVAHIEGRCSCCIVGSEEGDPPGMSKREAAQAAFEAGLRRRAEGWE